MRLATARLVKRRTDDGLVEMHDHVPLGKLYTVDLDSERTMYLQHVVTGKVHVKTLIWARQADGS